MVDVAELKRRHEALSATEDNKDKLIAVCFEKHPRSRTG